MPNTLFVMEKANLFCGKVAADQANSNHLILAELKLPTMDEQYVDHRAGGAPLAIEVDTIVARLEATFVLAGWTSQVNKLFYSWAADDNWFTAYGLVRDRVNGRPLQAIAQMKGRLGRADPVNWRNGDLQHWNYSIRGIVHYELVLADQPMYLWDFYSNTFIVGGRDRNADTNITLATGATNVAANIIPSSPVINAGGGGTIGV
jgi:phage tail tube protein FII